MAGRRESGIRPRGFKESIVDEGLIDVLNELQMRAFGANVGNLQTKGGAELPLNTKVPVLRVHIGEIRSDSGRTETGADDRSGRIFRGDAVGGGIGRDGKSKGRIAAHERNDIGGGVLSHERISGTNGHLAVVAGIPGEPNAWLEEKVVLLIRLRSGDQTSGGGIEIGEAIASFGGSGVPGVPKTDIDSEVWFPAETVLRENIVGRLKDAVVARAELNSKLRSLIGKELCQ